MESEICHKCGLLKDICACDVLDREEKIAINIITKKTNFGKYITIIKGINKNDLEQTASNMKKNLACGGTIKNDAIELQGNHLSRIKNVLISLGYLEENINILGEN